jgi:hypothetical protein
MCLKIRVRNQKRFEKYLQDLPQLCLTRKCLNGKFGYMANAKFFCLYWSDGSSSNDIYLELWEVKSDIPALRISKTEELCKTSSFGSAPFITTWIVAATHSQLHKQSHM